MRAIMYQPTKVWLATQANGDRWLTDQFVLLKITESQDFQPFPDGAYKLTVSKGPETRDAQAWPYIEGYLKALSGRDWKDAVPTDWSVAEDEVNKARLWSAEGEPCLFGESTWTEIRRYHPEVNVEYSYRGNGIFRFMELDHSAHHGEPHQCDCLPRPFAYAAGIRIPDGNEVAAKAIVGAL